jgi:hypothetical protein
MPFLGKELHLNYTQKSLHLSLFALGMLLAGLCGDYVARYGGHRMVFNGGAIGMALGAVCFSLSQQPFFTLASADIASARCTLAAGLAVLGAPLALGWMVDVVGLQPAYGIVPVLVVIAGGIAFLARRRAVSKRF